jgi:hypothetical protein
MLRSIHRAKTPMRLQPNMPSSTSRKIGALSRFQHFAAARTQNMAEFTEYVPGPGPAFIAGHFKCGFF